MPRSNQFSPIFGHTVRLPWVSAGGRKFRSANQNSLDRETRVRLYPSKRFRYLTQTP
jgi:hypothetical protein